MTIRLGQQDDEQLPRSIAQEFEQVVGSLQAAFAKRQRGQSLGLELGLQHRGEYASVVENEFDQLTAALQTAFAAGAIEVIQTGTISLLNATSASVTLTGFTDATRTLIFHLGTSGTGNNTDGSTQATRLLPNTAMTSLTASRGTSDANSVVVGYVAIQCAPDFVQSVQYGSILGNNTATVTAVNTAKAFVLRVGHETSDTTANMQTVMGRVTLTNNVTVTASQGANSTCTFAVIQLT